MNLPCTQAVKRQSGIIDRFDMLQRNIGQEIDEEEHITESISNMDHTCRNGNIA